MNKTIGVLAHVDAGKTTFSEQILYHTKSIRNRGRVDYKNTFLDSHNIERERGITIFLDQGNFSFNESNFYLIDTPGHMDFSSEMERAIEIMDYAIILICGVEGIQGHTEIVWNLLRKYNIPTFFFINKIDRIGSNVQRILEEIKLSLTKDVCYIDDSLTKDDINEEIIELIVEKDEKLIEKYLEGCLHRGLWLEAIKTMIKKNEIFPCFSGSALQDIGIVEFLENLDELTYTKYSNLGEFSGRVYKVRYDDKGNRVTYIKALQGSLNVKEEIRYGDNKKYTIEKINEIRSYNGSKFKTIDKIQSGEVFAVTGLSMAKPGDGVGILKEKNNYDMVPTLKTKVIFDKSINIKDVIRYFKILEAEEPSLNISWSQDLKELHINIMGIIQLEVIKQLMEERFKLKVDFAPCEILYKETINVETNGYGHFEPLGHYAEVHLKLEPGERNSGIIFENKCHLDDLSIGNQNLVRTHIYEKEHKGILTGSTITDLRITLLTGRAHKKHTSGGDFREATYRALRQGLEKAESILLEPYYNFKIQVEIDYMGRVLSDIQKLNGTFKPVEVIENRVIIRGNGPVATFMDYSNNLISFTKGKGRISLFFSGYDKCHNEEKIIEKFGYDKNSDNEYTSNSIFCSKGQGYIVQSKEVEEHMHCLI